MKANPILRSDAYKYTHYNQYPPNTQHVYSYFESRGGKYPEIMFYGLQMILKKHFVGQKIEQWMVNDAADFCKEVFGTDTYFNRAGWQRIIDIHGGKLPLRIKAVPEGSIVPTHNVFMTMENTDPELWWLTNFMETILVQMWYPITVCTESYMIKKSIERWARKTGTHVTPFHFHDFGFRGVSSVESAGIGGSAHLVNFMGTDTMEGIFAAKKYYHARLCGHSVVASEHSTMTSWGGPEYEIEAVENILNQCPDDKIVSIVIDSYDMYNFIKNILGGKLKDRIIKREGRVVARPDSGNPIEVSVKALQGLEEVFGVTTNDLGYKTINHNVGIIYGDGIEYESINHILANVVGHKYSVDNIVFGGGGALLQHPNRDTQKFAFKCSHAIVDGIGRDVYKKPITDSGKNSKAGRLILVELDNKLQTLREDNTEGISPIYDKMQTVFENGELLIETTFDEIRAIAESEFKKI